MYLYYYGFFDVGACKSWLKKLYSAIFIAFKFQGNGNICKGNISCNPKSNFMNQRILLIEKKKLVIPFENFPEYRKKLRINPL